MVKNKEFKATIKEGNRLIIRARLSYAHLDAPWAGNDQTEKKYSASLIIPKEDTATVATINKAIAIAKEEGKAKKWGGIIPKKLQIVFRDGDEERDDEAYENSYFFNASSRQPVKTMNRAQQECDPKDLYSGCWVLASVKMYPYDANGNKGIAAGLNQVMFWADDEPLGGSNTGNDFEDLEGTETEADDLDDL